MLSSKVLVAIHEGTAAALEKALRALAATEADEGGDAGGEPWFKADMPPRYGGEVGPGASVLHTAIHALCGWPEEEFSAWEAGEDVAMLKVLLSAGAELRALDGAGDSAAHVCARLGRTTLLRAISAADAASLVAQKAACDVEVSVGLRHVMEGQKLTPKQRRWLPLCALPNERSAARAEYEQLTRSSKYPAAPTDWGRPIAGGGACVRDGHDEALAPAEGPHMLAAHAMQAEADNAPGAEYTPAHEAAEKGNLEALRFLFEVTTMSCCCCSSCCSCCYSCRRRSCFCSC